MKVHVKRALKSYSFLSPEKQYNNKNTDRLIDKIILG